MTSNHHFHSRPALAGRVQRILHFIALSATIAAAIVVYFVAASGDSTVVDVGAQTASGQFEPNAPVSDLVDGPAFAMAVDTAVAAMQAPSILLDGHAFAEAVNASVAAIQSPSILLDAVAFESAVADAVASRDGLGVLLDGFAFATTVDGTVAECSE